MEKFAKRHARGILICSVALFCITVSLSVFLYFDFTAQREYREYTSYLSETEMKNSASSLVAALGAGDKMEAYHRAEMSALYASRLGDSAASGYFRRIAESLKSGDVSEDIISDEVGAFIESGVLPDGISAAEHYSSSATTEHTGSNEGFLYDYKMTEAKKTANEIFGLDGTLSAATKSSDGHFIFTCENAYAVIDEKTGMPTELGISIEGGEEILSLNECDALAREFMRRFLSAEIAASAVISDADSDKTGKYDLEYTCRDIKLTVSVKRDTGKIVGMVMK